MKNKLDNSHDNIEQDSIDVLAYLKKIWSERIVILKTAISFFFAGCLVALISPVEYTSQTTFVPQVSSDEITNNNKLGSLASLAGINLYANEVTSDSYLSPLVYTNIIDSEEFSLKLLGEEIMYSNGDKSTIKEYLLSNKNSFNLNPIKAIKKYTNKLFLNNLDSQVNSNILNNYNFISNEDFSLLKSFRVKFKIELNERDGYIKVLASDKDAFISTQIVDIITTSLQSKIIEIRTNKIRERLEFSREQYELKQVEFDILQNKLAEFKDSNKNISTARFMSKLQKLESEYQLQQNILINLASEYNSNKIKLNKDTPIFSVIDEVSVPNNRSKPKRNLIVMVFIFLGISLSVIFVFVKDTLINLIKEIKG